MTTRELVIANPNSTLKINSDYRITVVLGDGSLSLALDRNQAHMLYLFLKERFDK